MRAGRLINRLRVMRQVATVNTIGERADTWNEVYSIRCEIMILRGAQLEAARKLNEEVSYKIRARQTDQILPSDRLEDDAGTIYEMLAVISDPHARPRQFEALCRIVA